jgi:hypothetical protein
LSSKCFQLYYTFSDRLLAIALPPCSFHLFSPLTVTFPKLSVILCPLYRRSCYTEQDGRGLYVTKIGIVRQLCVCLNEVLPVSIQTAVQGFRILELRNIFILMCFLTIRGYVKTAYRVFQFQTSLLKVNPLKPKLV